MTKYLRLHGTAAFYPHDDADEAKRQLDRALYDAEVDALEGVNTDDSNIVDIKITAVPTVAIGLPNEPDRSLVLVTILVDVADPEPIEDEE